MNNISIAIKLSHFFVSSDTLSEKIGLQPTHSHREGETYTMKTPKGKVSKNYAYNYWEYREKFITDEWVQVLIDKFISDVLQPRKDILTELSLDGQLEFFVGIHYQSEANPGFHFDVNNLKFLAEIKAELDIDMYFLNGSE
jgi:hypothetical protein